jgi:hypothetical protein
MPTAAEPRKPRPSRKPWLLPTGLILLVVIPLAAGGYRLSQLIGGAPVTPENARFFHSPIPVVLHIVCACIYTLLGPFQFVPGFRRRRPGWHRVAGRVLIPAGLIVALSGLWMTLFYDLPSHDGELLAVFRYLFGSAMALSIGLGLLAIRRRDFTAHRAWMIRGYAIALGAGTQVLTTLPWVVVAGQPGVLPRALLLAAGWVINLIIAEWVIRTRPVNAGGNGQHHLAPPRPASGQRMGAANLGQ